MLQSMGLQRVRHDQAELFINIFDFIDGKTGIN